MDIATLSLSCGCVGSVAGALIAPKLKSPRMGTSILVGFYAAFISGSYTLTRRYLLASKGVDREGVSPPKAGVAAGALTGLLTGAVIGKPPRQCLAMSVAGVMVAFSGEVANAQYVQWRLDKLLEDKHPSLKQTRPEPSLIETMGWSWPEWMPIQNVNRDTRITVLDNKIRSLQSELDLLNSLAISTEQLDACDT
eukprot:m.31891 g.31891  ORF g.31891 m.31891 type:complete len:195 (+) comp8357_c0_seq1:83-667(+)